MTITHTTNNIIAKLQNLLGKNTVLIPCTYGTKIPIIEGWPDFPAEIMDEPEYIDLFNVKDINIGVLLGNVSSNLVSIDFDTDAAAAHFLDVNPLLKDSLITKGARGCNVWIRVNGEYPVSCNIGELAEWRADKRHTIIHGKHPTGCDYIFQKENNPIVIKFSDIKWPDGWPLPWNNNLTNISSAVALAADSVFTHLTKLYGDFVYRKCDDEVDDVIIRHINERAWAGLYAFENRIIYDPDDQTFYKYIVRNGLWAQTPSENIIAEIADRMIEVSRDWNAPTLEERIKQKTLREIIEALKGITAKSKAFDNKAQLIHLANGVVSFEESDDILFTGFSPDYFSRRQSPIPYRKDATCHRFLDELIYPVINPKDVDLLQRIIGLFLLGINLPQRIVILIGAGGLGKGTLVNIIKDLIGAGNFHQLRMSQLDSRFEFFRYRHKTLLYGSDVSSKYLSYKNASFLKSLVGNDPLDAEGKNLRGDFPLNGDFNILITSNTKPHINLDSDSSAWSRRLLLIEYQDVPPPKKVVNFHKILMKDEGPGILRWGLQGLAKLLDEIRTGGDFILEPEQKAKIANILTESDSLSLFINENISVSPSSDITVEEIVEAYSAHCLKNGWAAKPRRVIERELPDLMLANFHKSKSHSIKRGNRQNRGWNGVKLN